MLAGINKPFTQNPSITFSRIENNSELHYMRKKYQSYRWAYRMLTFLTLNVWLSVMILPLLFLVGSWYDTEY